MKKLIVLLFIAGLSSCTTSPFEGEISTTDSLSMVVDSLNQKMASIDLVKTKEVGKKSSVLQQYLSINYPDSLDRNFWVNKMTPLYDIQRILSKFLASEADIRKEIGYTIEQLKTFRNSLKDGKLTKEEAKKYLMQEKNAVSQISYFMEKYHFRVIKGLKDWEKINQEMYRISDSIKAL